NYRAKAGETCQKRSDIHSIAGIGRFRSLLVEVMIERDQGRISQNLVALGHHAMRVTPHAKTIRRAKLSHGGFESAHAVCVVFQKNYCLAIHDLRSAVKLSNNFNLSDDVLVEGSQLLHRNPKLLVIRIPHSLDRILRDELFANAK